MNTVDHSIPDSGVTISISDEGRQYLIALSDSENSAFNERQDAYRFAVALSLALNRDEPPDEPSQVGTTLYNIGSFDNANIFKESFMLVAPRSYKEIPLTKLIRRHAEWGLRKMHELLMEQGGDFYIPDAIESVRNEIAANRQVGT